MPQSSNFEGQDIYEIDSERCTECVGFYDRQTCVDVCPIECVSNHNTLKAKRNC
jgi:formate hydrogenlyase subunit 6/NADH:ubiquinone oxidoreductase subunit I